MKQKYDFGYYMDPLFEDAKGNLASLENNVMIDYVIGLPHNAMRWMFT